MLVHCSTQTFITEKMISNLNKDVFFQILEKNIFIFEKRSVFLIKRSHEFSGKMNLFLGKDIFFWTPLKFSRKAILWTNEFIFRKSLSNFLTTIGYFTYI